MYFQNAKIYGEFAASLGRTESSAPTKLSGTPGTVVGVDADIDPAVQSVFMKIQCEFVGAQWGDVGIAPYAKKETVRKIPGMCGHPGT